MVGLVDGLEAKGFVARRADAGDRRRNVLELTRDGHRALAEAVRASDEAERRLLAGLDDAESAQLRTLLTRLARDRSERWQQSRSPSDGRSDARVPAPSGSGRRSTARRRRLILRRPDDGPAVERKPPTCGMELFRR